METNTVLLSLNDYNELRDFQKKISEGYIEVYGNSGLRIYYTTKDEVIKEIAAHNKDLTDKIGELGGKISRLKHLEMFKPTNDDFKKMSIWQFIKWKRNG